MNTKWHLQVNKIENWTSIAYTYVILLQTNRGAYVVYMHSLIRIKPFKNQGTVVMQIGFIVLSENCRLYLDIYIGSLQVDFRVEQCSIRWSRAE